MGIHCHDLKKGQILACEDCGIELQVIKECTECATPEGECACSEPCTFSCCGDKMKIKS